MTMQETKQKSKRSRQQIKEDFKKALNTTKAVFVKELAEAIRDENPQFDNDRIKAELHEDCNELGLNHDSVFSWYPSWLQEDKRRQVAFKGWETRNARALEASKKNLLTLNKTAPSEPPEPKQSYEHEDLDLEGGRLASYGEKGKSISKQKGDITYHAARLFEALTEIDHLPYKDEDITVDYIKPTRQFRKSLILELDEQSQKTVWNCLGAVNAAIDDTLDILEDEMKK